MADRIDLARKYLDLQREGKIDEAVAMLSDDVIASNPMMGTQTGKPAVEEAMRNRPAAAGGMTLEWGEPKQEGDTVSIVATGSPFGPIKVSVGFNSSDQIDKIEIGMGA
jgi:hypothetical protein